MGLLTVHSFVEQVGVVASSSSDDDSGYGILALPFVLAISFWLFTYRRYRNQDARYNFEHTTSQVSNLQPVDVRVDHRTGLKSSTVQGRNDDDATASVPVDKMWDDPPVTH